MASGGHPAEHRRHCQNGAAYGEVPRRNHRQLPSRSHGIASNRGFHEHFSVARYGQLANRADRRFGRSVNDERFRWVVRVDWFLRDLLCLIDQLGGVAGEGDTIDVTTARPVVVVMNRGQRSGALIQKDWRYEKS